MRRRIDDNQSATMRWTQEQLDAYYERHKIRRRNKADGEASGPVAEPALCNEPVAKARGEKGDAVRVHVRVVSFRRKLCDPDNLCPKYFIDCLRSAGLIRDDSPEHITLEVAQEKVRAKTDERTEITLSGRAD